MAEDKGLLIALDGRTKAFAETALAGWPGLREYFVLDGYSLRVPDPQPLSSGAYFFVQAFLSLHRRETLDLGRVRSLDPKNFEVFLTALRAWYEA